MKLTFFTDGAVKNNGGAGRMGYAAIAVWGDQRREFSEFCDSESATNQRAEVLAVILAAQAVPNKKRPEIDLTIVTDSEWAIECLKKLLGLPSLYKKIQCNLDLLEATASVLSTYKSVTFRHVRGHRGDELNERANFLAQTAAGTWKGRKEAKR